ncbi:MAG: xanthine dehydrogenase family protein subunit M [Ardenticatenales bacterium]|nr:xanthine dehydrogenase family protein subunit M [Ardenticatenales bacterium]
MKPAPFDYAAPDSLPASLSLIAAYGDDGKLLAGGQSLVPALNFRLLQPSVLIDLNRVTELAGITRTAAGGLRLGAMTRQAQVERSPLTAQLAPLLAETMPQIAHPQIRNRGTIGGSMVHADPAAELPVAAVALDAVFEIAGEGGVRRVPAKSFFQSLFTVDITPDEILTAVEFPPWPARTGGAFVEVARRRGDYALAGVAVVVTLDDAGKCARARIVYLNLGDGPIDAEGAAGLLQNELLTLAAIEAAADFGATQEIAPAGNIHATPDFQRHLARVLTRRALTTAAARAKVG